GANQKLDPGETADIKVHFVNEGHASAKELEAVLSVSSELITINSQDLYFEQINAGEVLTGIVNITVSEEIPEGYTPFQFEISYFPGFLQSQTFEMLVGRFPCCIVDLGEDRVSGTVLDSIMENLGVPARHYNTFPASLEDYMSVFLCLGGTFSFYPLSAGQGEYLKNYLENGGNLYIEGSNTWNEYPQTVVHPMFYVNPVEFTWHEIITISGIQGTFTEGYQWDYIDPKPYYCYYLDPLEEASTILETGPDNHSLAVINQQENYRTIASEIEFGYLSNSIEIGSQDTLLKRYLEFFGHIFNHPSGISQNGITEDNIKVNVYPNPFRNNIFIKLSLLSDAEINIIIYDISGKKIHTLTNGLNLFRGEYNFNWDGIDHSGKIAPPGIYLIGIHCKNAFYSRKILKSE
ncbi:MAG: T9SS type A sorting domain-containing protein, partial [Bacteroidales bacterium]|nr:T9SS type A sorting domain-containing protein [Bacteroidales bacterium]